MDSSVPSSVIIEPCRAPVVPRARTLPNGEILPLERIVRRYIDRRERGIVQLNGTCGCGKSTALAHLAAVLPGDADLILLDDPQPGEFELHATKHLVIAANAKVSSRCLARLQMAPWQDDDLIEYLLAIHPKQCASVMSRVKLDVDRSMLRGLPQLWRIVLDEMCADESIRYVASGLRRYLLGVLKEHRCTSAALTFCLRCSRLEDAVISLPGPAWRLLRHRVVQVLLGAEHLVELICQGADRDELERLPRDVIIEAALLVRSRPEALRRLQDIVHHNDERAPGAASILAGADACWRPATASPVRLHDALLEGMYWSGIDLTASSLQRANLSQSDLSGAALRNALAQHADFHNCNLHAAELQQLDATSANFSGADLALARLEAATFVGANLEQANLEGARLGAGDFTGAALSGARLAHADLSFAALTAATFSDTDLTRANLTGARLDHVRLAEATLTGARFEKALLPRCDLENVRAEEVDFSKADLTGSLLTGSILPRVRFREANLSNTGLADVEWEGADLRRANLRGATFHLGSSRSGLVGSTIPCEGSKTGFYTDEFSEQDYKSPEEIRKANLRGADLRGAKIKGVDFYLVDLRGARYTKKQARYFRRCGAIL